MSSAVENVKAAERAAALAKLREEQAETAKAETKKKAESTPAESIPAAPDKLPQKIPELDHQQDRSSEFPKKPVGMAEVPSKKKKGSNNASKSKDAASTKPEAADKSNSKDGNGEVIDVKEQIMPTIIANRCKCIISIEEETGCMVDVNVKDSTLTVSAPNEFSQRNAVEKIKILLYQEQARTAKQAELERAGKDQKQPSTLEIQKMKTEVSRLEKAKSAAEEKAATQKIWIAELEEQLLKEQERARKLEAQIMKLEVEKQATEENVIEKETSNLAEPVLVLETKSEEGETADSPDNDSYSSNNIGDVIAEDASESSKSLQVNEDEKDKENSDEVDMTLGTDSSSVQPISEIVCDKTVDGGSNVAIEEEKKENNGGDAPGTIEEIVPSQAVKVNGQPKKITSYLSALQS